VGSRRGAQRGKGFSSSRWQMPWAALRSPERLDRRRVGGARAVFVRGAGRGTGRPELRNAL